MDTLTVLFDLAKIAVVMGLGVFQVLVTDGMRTTTSVIIKCWRFLRWCLKKYIWNIHAKINFKYKQYFQVKIKKKYFVCQGVEFSKKKKMIKIQQIYDIVSEYKTLMFSSNKTKINFSVTMNANLIFLYKVHISDIYSGLIIYKILYASQQNPVNDHTHWMLCIFTVNY